MPITKQTDAKLNKGSISRGKKITIATLIGAIIAGSGAATMVKNNVKPLDATASDGTSKSDSVDNLYEADYLDNHNLDINALVSNENALTVGDMIKLINDKTGVELSETLFDLYNMRYLAENLNELNIPENKIWSTLIDYRADLNEVASYGMAEYYNLSTALRDNDSKKINKWGNRLPGKVMTPFDIITKESYAYRTFRDRYVSIVDKQAEFIKSGTLFAEENKEEVEANARAFYELAQEIRKTSIMEADFARQLKKNKVDMSKVDAITASEGIVLGTFVTANYLMFKDVYLKLDKEQNNVKYIKYFENEFQNYFDHFDEIMRKYYNLSEKECEEVKKKTKEYEKIIYNEKNNREPSKGGDKKRTVKKTIKKSKKIGEVTTKTKVKPGKQVVDDKNGEKADVKVDKDGNGSADVHHDGGEPITHKEVTKPAEKITEEDKAPEQPSIPSDYVLSEEEYERLVNGTSLSNNNVTFKDDEKVKDKTLIKH